MKRSTFALILAAALLMLATSVWEGTAVVATASELPTTGLYVSTNAFPHNTVVDIKNLETNRTVRATVAGELTSPGLLAVLSREAAAAIGLDSSNVGRVRITMPADPIAFSHFTEGMVRSGDPDFDPQAAIKDQLPQKPESPIIDEKPQLTVAEPDTDLETATPIVVELPEIASVEPPLLPDAEEAIPSLSEGPFDLPEINEVLDSLTLIDEQPDAGWLALSKADDASLLVEPAPEPVFAKDPVLEATTVPTLELKPEIIDLVLPQDSPPDLAEAIALEDSALTIESPFDKLALELPELDLTDDQARIIDSSELKDDLLPSHTALEQPQITELLSQDQTVPAEAPDLSEPETIALAESLPITKPETQETAKLQLVTDEALPEILESGRLPIAPELTTTLRPVEDLPSEDEALDIIEVLSPLPAPYSAELVAIDPQKEEPIIVDSISQVNTPPAASIDDLAAVDEPKAPEGAKADNLPPFPSSAAIPSLNDKDEPSLAVASAAPFAPVASEIAAVPDPSSAELVLVPAEERPPEAPGESWLNGAEVMPVPDSGPDTAPFSLPEDAFVAAPQEVPALAKEATQIEASHLELPPSAEIAVIKDAPDLPDTTIGPPIIEPLLTILPSLEDQEPEAPRLSSALAPASQVTAEPEEVAIIPTSPAVEERILKPTELFTAPFIEKLEAGKFYLQLGAFGKSESVETALAKLARYPTAVQTAGTNETPIYRVYVGPVNQGESGALLVRLKQEGYKDVFIRQGS